VLTDISWVLDNAALKSLAYAHPTRITSAHDVTLFLDEDDEFDREFAPELWEIISRHNCQQIPGEKRRRGIEKENQPPQNSDTEDSTGSSGTDEEYKVLLGLRNPNVETARTARQRAILGKKMQQEAYELDV
jgi:hypothetical protein